MSKRDTKIKRGKVSVLNSLLYEAEQRKPVGEIEQPKRNLSTFVKMDEVEAFGEMLSHRWAEQINCVSCGHDAVTVMETRGLFRCYRCRHQFSFMSGSIFGSSKLAPSKLMTAAYIFCAAKKGMSSIQTGNMLGVGQKTAWILNHKFREAIAIDVDRQTLRGVVEIDGATFGGHRKNSNMAQNFSGNFKRFSFKNTNEKCVVVVAKQRLGRTIPFVVQKESEACDLIMAHVERGSVIQADEGKGWDSLKELYEMMRIKHCFQFSSNTACTNNAESYFAQLRKAHAGTFHKINKSKMRLYASEIAWKRDFKDLTTEQLTMELLKLCMAAPKSAEFCGYWQRRAA